MTEQLRKLAMAATPHSWSAAMVALSLAMERNDSIVVLTREQLLALLDERDRMQRVIEAAKALAMNFPMSARMQFDAALAELEGKK